MNLVTDLTGLPSMVVLNNDYFVGVYVDGVKSCDGTDLDAETLIRVCGAACFEVPQDVYSEVLNGAGYPDRLEDFPLDRCTRSV